MPPNPRTAQLVRAAYKLGYARACADAQRQIDATVEWLNDELTKARADVWSDHPLWPRAVTEAIHERANGADPSLTGRSTTWRLHRQTGPDRPQPLARQQWKNILLS